MWNNMRSRVLLHTLSHLTIGQLYYQVWYRFVRSHYKPYKAPAYRNLRLGVACINRCPCFKDGQFTFLNISSPFTTWTDTANGLLWTFNLNYFDWLEQMEKDEACFWIDRFIDGLSDNPVGQDAYPTALRTLNWVKFFAANPDCITRQRLDSLYSQYRQLENSIEYHRLGNHILEDAYALVIGSLAFADARMWKRSTRLLVKCLRGQTLPDGTNYEQSPMYHCILLDRLLDVYNISLSNNVFGNQGEFNGVLADCAVSMLGALTDYTWSDGSIPLLNDSVYGIAPTADELFAYARRLGLDWGNTRLHDCGYRHYKRGCFETFIDIGNVTAKDQPSHTHADTFSYELRIDGSPFVVDTGISTYNKTVRRQYERGTSAHNTVVVDGCDSSEVWAGFRVGKRAEVTVFKDDDCHCCAVHNGYGNKKPVEREFTLSDNFFEIKDHLPFQGSKVSYIHFAPGISLALEGNDIITDIAVVRVYGCDRIELADDTVSKIYNQFESVRVAKIYFSSDCSYKIEKR